MKDNSDTLPFWGKQKPLKKYLRGYSLSFSVKKRHLFCTVTKTTKTTKQKLYTFEVENKTHLDQLLNVKNNTEICSVEIIMS